jgi:hypothetical protein
LVCGILVWDYLEVVQEDFQPFPGMQDYLCLALLPLFIAAFFHFRAETPYARAALRKLCNLAILLCGATVVLLLLKPHTVLAVSESPAWILTAAAYLVLSVGAVSFGVTCWVLYVGPAERRVLLITLLGLAAHSAGNFIYGYSVFRKNFAVGGAADFLWLLSFALIAWAAWEQRGQSPQALQPSRKDAPRPRLEELEATLPAGRHRRDSAHGLSHAGRSSSGSVEPPPAPARFARRLCRCARMVELARGVPASCGAATERGPLPPGRRFQYVGDHVLAS